MVYVNLERMPDLDLDMLKRDIGLDRHGRSARSERARQAAIFLFSVWLWLSKGEFSFHDDAVVVLWLAGTLSEAVKGKKSLPSPPGVVVQES
jgi:hypothetical protein